MGRRPRRPSPVHRTRARRRRRRPSQPSDRSTSWSVSSSVIRRAPWRWVSASLASARIDP